MQVQRTHNERAAEPGLNVLAEPDDGRAFLLAGVSHASLTRHYRRRAGLCLLCAGTVTWLLDATGRI